MDLTNDTSEGEIDYVENMEEANLPYRSSHYRATPYPQQQLRFRWSTPANGANGQERDIVSPNFTFSPDHNICSPTMYDSGISNGFPYSPNVGSTVMYKFPAQHGNSRTNSSKFWQRIGMLSNTLNFLVSEGCGILLKCFCLEPQFQHTLFYVSGVYG